jgi:hypothetical protein
MTIAMGADDAGYPLKTEPRDARQATGREPAAVGVVSAASTDSPGFTIQVAGTVTSGGADRGVPGVRSDDVCVETAFWKSRLNAAAIGRAWKSSRQWKDHDRNHRN